MCLSLTCCSQICVYNVTGARGICRLDWYFWDVKRLGNSWCFCYNSSKIFWFEWWWFEHGLHIVSILLGIVDISLWNRCIYYKESFLEFESWWMILIPWWIQISIMFLFTCTVLTFYFSRCRRPLAWGTQMK